MRPGDVVIALIAATITAMLAMHSQAASRVERVRVRTAEAIEDHPAWRDATLKVNGRLGATVIEIRDGKARVVESPCSQKLCLRGGWLERAGDATACVPNQISVVLLGDGARYDAINF